MLALPINSHGGGQLFLQLFVTGLVRRMVRQETHDRWWIFVAVHGSFPDPDSSFGVIAGFGHVGHTNAIGFCFVGTGIFGDDEPVIDEIGAVDDGGGSIAALGLSDGGAAGDNEVNRQIPGHLFAGMAASDVGNFVSRNGGELIVVGYEPVFAVPEAGEVKDFATWGGHGIHDISMEDGDFVGELRGVRDGGDIADDFGDAGEFFGIVVNRDFLPAHGRNELGLGLLAHPDIVIDRVEIEALPAGDEIDGCTGNWAKAEKKTEDEEKQRFFLDLP